MPATENHTLKAGDDKIFEFTIDPSDIATLDGCTVRWWMARSQYSDAADVDLVKDNISGSDGTIEISSPGTDLTFSVTLTREDTLDFIGDYYHEAQVVDILGNYATVTTGTLTFERTLVRPEDTGEAD